MEKFCTFFLILISLSSLIHGKPHHNLKGELQNESKIESSTGKSLKILFLLYF